MDHIWSILELEPTRDVSAIRQAYAEKTRTCHPEETPTGFLELRKAYQAAMDYAEGGIVSPPQGEMPDSRPLRQDDREEDQEVVQEPDEGEEEAEFQRPAPFGWTLLEEEPDSGPNPYAEHEAIRKIEELYTGKQRKDPKRWIDYFTSHAFLDVAWEPRFTELMLEKVTEVERILPPGREFLMWLSAVWLNTGFYSAHDPESGALLSDYLKQCLPYQEEWSRRFLQKADGTIQPRTVAVCMGEMEVEARLCFLEYRSMYSAHGYRRPLRQGKD